MDAINKNMAGLKLVTNTTDAKATESSQDRKAMKGKKVPKKKLSKLTTEELRSALESLPQELYDKIYVATFTARSGGRVMNEPDKRVRMLHYKLLHISRASRELYARTYYGNGSTFGFFGEKYPGRPDILYDTSAVAAWLKMLPEAHRALIHEVTMRQDIRFPSTSKHFKFLAARDFFKTKYHGSQEEKEAIATKVFLRVKGGYNPHDWKPACFDIFGRLTIAGERARTAFLDWNQG